MVFLTEKERNIDLLFAVVFMLYQHKICRVKQCAEQRQDYAARHFGVTHIADRNSHLRINNHNIKR